MDQYPNIYASFVHNRQAYLVIFVVVNFRIFLKSNRDHELYHQKVDYLQIFPTSTFLYCKHPIEKNFNNMTRLIFPLMNLVLEILNYFSSDIFPLNNKCYYEFISEKVNFENQRDNRTKKHFENKLN